MGIKSILHNFLYDILAYIIPGTVIITTCDFCNFTLKVVTLRPPPIRKTCPKCGKENLIKDKPFL
jgi:hypothetical protein